VRVIKVSDAPLFKIIDEARAFTTASVSCSGIADFAAIILATHIGATDPSLLLSSTRQDAPLLTKSDSYHYRFPSLATTRNPALARCRVVLINVDPALPNLDRGDRDVAKPGYHSHSISNIRQGPTLGPVKSCNKYDVGAANKKGIGRKTEGPVGRTGL
jgi:hypothetical protein